MGCREINCSLFIINCFHTFVAKNFQTKKMIKRILILILCWTFHIMHTQAQSSVAFLHDTCVINVDTIKKGLQAFHDSPDFNKWRYAFPKGDVKIAPKETY